MPQTPIYMSFFSTCMVNPPEPLNEGVSRSMRSNKRKDTRPEIILRKALRDAGKSGYRLQWKAAGHPDICYPGRKVAIFVNGCFWHRCPYCNLPLPKHNAEYWQQKFVRNVARDARVKEQLESEGWKVIIIWECKIKQDLPSCVSEIVDSLSRM